MIDDATLFAFIDGELDAEDGARVEAALAADPDLAERMRAHVAMRERLRAAFDPMLAEPLPPRLLDAAQPAAAPVVDLAAARARPPERRARSGWMRYAALAASLALGIVVGRTLDQGPAPLVVERGGAAVAGRMLAASLDRQLASAPEADAAIRVALSFRARDGRLCRSFSSGNASGVACRAGDGWDVRGLFAGEAAGANYRMAAGGDPRLGALVDELAAGPPLDAAQEREARARGWR